MSWRWRARACSVFRAADWSSSNLYARFSMLLQCLRRRVGDEGRRDIFGVSGRGGTGALSRWRRSRGRFARRRHGRKWTRLGAGRRFARRFIRWSRKLCHVLSFSLGPSSVEWLPRHGGCQAGTSGAQSIFLLHHTSTPTPMTTATDVTARTSPKRGDEERPKLVHAVPALRMCACCRTNHCRRSVYELLSDGWPPDGAFGIAVACSGSLASLANIRQCSAVTSNMRRPIRS
ncbi:hypothetical protein SAMN02990966_07766 [Rhodospirillales bacterium URHD0017]|nr:hypothetical protein SAMN02990966_07766 [Rhodospirillales bacterium URHD0017]